VGNMCAKIKCPRCARFDELNQQLTGQKGLREAAARVCSLPRIRSPMFTVGYGTVGRSAQSRLQSLSRDTMERSGG
jgi:hypothetical protein